MSDVVAIEKRDGIAVLRFNREAALNAMSIGLAKGIVSSLVALDADDSVKGIVLTGAGSRAFCAGVDLREARAVTVPEVESWFGTVCNVYRQILLTKKPIVAAINGVAAGAGFQVALVSDLRVGEPGTRMGQPEINAGIPSVMGAYWMSLHLSWSKNQELSMTGRLMPADECERLGLLNYVVPAEQLVDKAVDVARTLSGKPSVAWARTKKRFSELALAGFEEAFRAGVLGQQEAFAKGEPQAIMDAFIAKRGGTAS